MIFSVENYSGTTTLKRVTRQRATAVKYANETPHSSIAVYDDNGWLRGEWIFSPKHPPPAR